jgi:transposase
MKEVIALPGPAKLAPKGGYGISFWVFILLGKFLNHRPLCRILTELRDDHGLDVSPGTVTGGLERLRLLFVPLYQGIVERNLSEGQWHADETRWLVFAEMEGKASLRWYLGVFCSKTTVVYRLEPIRSSQVPRDHFGEDSMGILVVDRYSAYKVLLKNGRILLAFCWAHVRWDFFAVAKDWPKEEEWALEWLEKIGGLCAFNETELKVLDIPDAFNRTQARLREAVEEMAHEREEQLSDPKLHPACRKVLKSLKDHWDGWCSLKIIRKSRRITTMPNGSCVIKRSGVGIIMAQVLFGALPWH